MITLLLHQEEVIDLQSSDDDFEKSPKRRNMRPSPPPVTRGSESLSTSTCSIDVCPRYVTHYCSVWKLSIHYANILTFSSSPNCGLVQGYERDYAFTPSPEPPPFSPLTPAKR